MKNIPFFESYNSVEKKLTLRDATYFPEEILDFVDDVEILDMSHGQLSSLPDSFEKLEKLKIVFFSNNPFEEVPKILAECPNLFMIGFKSCNISTFAENSLPLSTKWLILTHNKIKKLPTSIGKLVKLQKLSLAGNQLESLPEEMTNCKNLELIRLAVNNFKTPPPEWLFELPHLAWYGDASNPFHTQNSSNKSLVPNISWKELVFGEKIGESPSSTVFVGLLKKTQKKVAIKVFKGELTSDGLPIDDMKASIAAGTHKNLINILGELLPNSDGKQGLVLSLIPNSYKSLGLPPNFDTCTRDVYPKDSSFSLSYVLNVLTSIASAADHLHKKGIMHGDLYAHNILSNKEGKSLLGDFGAASFYQPSENKAREKIDVRAFGYLIEDLITLLEEKELSKNDKNLLKEVINLKKSCLNNEVSKQPFFKEIYKTLLASQSHR